MKSPADHKENEIFKAILCIFPAEYLHEHCWMINFTIIFTQQNAQSWKFYMNVCFDKFYYIINAQKPLHLHICVVLAVVIVAFFRQFFGKEQKINALTCTLTFHRD